MSQATQNHTPPTRRGALQFSAAALFAGLTVPAIASTTPDPDAELIALCDRFVSLQTEWHLLMEHDEWVSDFGPNNARYEHLDDEKSRLSEMIEDHESPTTPAGCAALARAALTSVVLDHEGNIRCDTGFEELLVRVAQGVAVGFVWPPRPGSCSTAHWAPPTSPKEIAEQKAAHHARMAQIDEEIRAKKLAEAAERQRRDTPSLMTDEELQGQLRTSRWLVARANEVNAELSAEMARRGLEVA
jgi:hypothetical protein